MAQRKGQRGSSGPPCPVCGARRSRVTDRREHRLYPAVIRRRECLSCGWRFTTDEKLVMPEDGKQHARKPTNDERPA